jgi:hypothetical protein
MSSMVMLFLPLQNVSALIFASSSSSVMVDLLLAVRRGTVGVSDVG